MAPAFTASPRQQVKDMLQGRQDSVQILSNRPGASRQVNDQALPPDGGDPPARHGPFANLHAIVTHGLGDPRD